MITNVDYLIQKFAEAREKMNDADTDSGRYYWNGAMNTYHALLTEAFEGWAAPGSTGYYVFYEQMNYDKALDQVEGILK